MKFFNKHSIAVASIMLAISATPSIAAAKGNVHLNLPGISINVSDHHGKSYRRHSKKYRNSNRRGHSKSYRHSRKDYKRNYRKNYRNNYYGDYRVRNYRYDKRRYNKGYYNSYGGNRNYSRDRNYDRSRSVEYCPTAGFSLYIDNDRDCYGHKDHYHCN